MENTQQFPTEVIDLPSKGKFYSPSSPLSTGKIELKYMTAKEEDILSNANYIAKGIAIDKLLKALIVDKTVDYDSLLVGDKNAILVAARILGFGAEYEFEYLGVKESIDLGKLETKPLHPEVEAADKNEFTYKLPATGNVISFKLLTHADEIAIDNELKGLKKLRPDDSPEISTRYKHMITAVNGNREPAAIRNFVDTGFITRDTRAFRKHIVNFQPDLDMKFYPENGPAEGVNIPMGVTFLWPDAQL